MDREDPSTDKASDSALCLLAYRDADGVVSSVGPLSRERAEALVEVYGRMYPNQTCWVEPLPKQVETLQTGKVRRARLLPRGH